MHPSIWSLVPFAVVIPFAILSRQVIPGLVAGLFVGAYLLTPTPLGGVNTALAYLYKELQVPGNLHLIVFLYTFGMLVGLIRVTGGVSGLAAWLAPRIRTVRQAFAVTWLSSLATFMAPDFRIITVAPIMQPIMRRYGVDPRRLAYVIDVTSTPLIALVPVGTAFVGYTVGLLAVSLKHVGSPESAYPFFLRTIPLNFFAIAILLIGAYLSFFGKDKAEKIDKTVKTEKDVAARRGAAAVQVRSAAWRAEAGTELGTAARDKAQDAAGQPQEPLEVYAERARPDVWNLAVPLSLLLLLTFGLTWWSGHAKASTFFGVLVQADAIRAMLQAILITLVLAGVFYMARGQKMDRILFGALSGGNEMVPVVTLLVLVWAVAGIATELGFSQYVGSTVGRVVPAAFIAPVIFVLGSVISYFIGSSFGTWGILLPLGLSIASTTHASLPLVAGAVFASGTLGGFASPLSDNTVAMATVMKLPVVEFANSLLKTSLLAGVIATAGYAAASFIG